MDMELSEDVALAKPHTASGKKRSTRACDQCRKAKSRCDLPPDGRSCSNCNGAGIECSTSGPTRKRGPPKGYLHAVETRLREAEAIIGILLRSEDPSIVSFVEELSRDPAAKNILARVDLSHRGGLIGRDNDGDAGINALRRRDSQGSLAGPTPEWHDHVLAGLGQQSPRSRISPPRYAFGSTPKAQGIHEPSPSSLPRSSYMRERMESEDERFSSHDTQSEKDDAIGPAAPISKGVPRSEQVVGDTKGGLMQRSLSDPGGSKSTNLPAIGVQKQLLDTYFTCIHPTFPIISKVPFMREHDQRYGTSVETTRRSGQTSESFDLLLTSIFTTAGYRNAGGRTMSEAHNAIQLAYQQPDISACQSLLILGIHEFGIGGVTQAWLYIGLAIRVAQDLGLHKSTKHWISDGRVIFSEDEIDTRERVWYGCLKADRYLSMYMCRPLSIHDPDFDTQMIIEPRSNSEDMDAWNALSIQNSSGFYTPVPGRLISCYNANVLLSRIVGRILVNFYAHNSQGVGADDLKRELEEWLERLPPEIQVNDHNTTFTAPSHFLSLNTEYQSAVILLNRPSLRFSLHGAAQKESTRSWQDCIAAAQHINDITKAWKVNFSLGHATAFFVYDVYHAGLIWIGARKYQTREERFDQNLEFCLEALKAMEATHSVATRARQLLLGARVPPIEGLVTPTVEQLLSPPNRGVPVDPIFMNGYIWRIEV